MKRALLGLLIVCLTMGLASVAFAGENAIAGISLHVTEPTAKAANCNNQPDFPDGPDSINPRGWPCFDFVDDPNSSGKTKVEFVDFNIWLLVCNGSDSVGVAGLEVGLNYDGALGSGVDINSWQLCADLEFTSGSWPAQGSGTVITWEPSFNCQSTSSVPDTVFNHMVIAVAGVFNITAYGADFIDLIPRPVSGAAKIADCRAVEDDITANKFQLGRAGFCRNSGKSWCEYLTPGPDGTFLDDAESTTWGKVKSMY